MVIVRATYDGDVVAESDDVRVVQGISYFPRDAVKPGVLVESPTVSRCPWKGKANYFHVQHGDDVELDAAFTYEKPWPLARRLVTGRVGFWQGVSIED